MSHDRSTSPAPSRLMTPRRTARRQSARLRQGRRRPTRRASGCCRSTFSAGSRSPACSSSTTRAPGARSIRRSSTRTWNGWTPTDLIFPFFLFIAGVTTHLSLTRAPRARRRRSGDPRARSSGAALLIFLFGFLVNGFPFFTWGDVAGIADPTLPPARRRSPATLADHGRAAAHRPRLHVRGAAHARARPSSSRS